MSKLIQGKFIHSANSSSEVFQMWKGKSENQIPNRELRILEKRIWPSFELGLGNNPGNEAKSLWTGDFGSNNGLQGWQPDKDLNGNRIWIDPREVHEFDPSYLNECKVLLRCLETSYWHKISFTITVITDNANENFLEFKIYNGVDHTLIGSADDNGTIVDSFNDLKSEEKIWLNSKKEGNFFNYQLEAPINNLSIRRFKFSCVVNPDNLNYPNDKINGILNNFIQIQFDTKSNNSSYISSTAIYVSSIHTMLGEEIELDSKDIVPIALYWQKPNVLFYTHLHWCTNYDAYVGKSEVPTMVENYEIDYNNNNANVYLCMELGLSIDGGKTIYWNDTHKKELGEKNSSITNISCKVPALDLSKICLEITGDKKDNILSYNINNQQYGENGYPCYVTFILNSKSNNDENNSDDEKNVDFFIDKKEIVNEEIPENKEEVKYIYPTDYPELNLDNPMIMATYFPIISKNDPSNSIRTRFCLRKKVTTNNWDLKIKAILNITNGMAKYHGETE